MVSRHLRAITRAAAFIAVFLPGTVIALAQSEPGLRYYHGPGMMWGDGYWGGFGMIFGLLFMLLVFALIGIAIVLVLRAFGVTGAVPATATTGRNQALDILKERFARGEIDAEEFDRRKRLLAE